MNYTAIDNETIESILLVGPTGTGKTETVKAACEYLSLPYIIANTSNLVPQGIKGVSIEKLLKDLENTKVFLFLSVERLFIWGLLRYFI